MNVDHYDMRNTDEFKELTEHHQKYAKQHELHINNSKFRSVAGNSESSLAKIEKGRVSKTRNSLRKGGVTDEQLKQLQSAYNNLRTILIELYSQNPPNASSIKKIIVEMIQKEKDQHLYNPANWEEFKSNE